MPRLDTKISNSEKRQLKRSFDTGRIYMAEVMDVRSVSRSGDLLVYLIGSELDKNDEHNWVHASYASNFYGTTPYEAQSKSTYENAPQSFGQWFPMPCVGNYVFVFFPVSSAENVMCYWFACPVNPFTNYMLPGIPSANFGTDDKPNFQALCERNDKCSNASQENPNKTSVNENNVNSNIVDKDGIPSDEQIKLLQQIIKQYNISENDLSKIASQLSSNGEKNNIYELSRYMNNNTSINYANGVNLQIAQSLLSAYNSGNLNLDNLSQFYSENDELLEGLSNMFDKSLSGKCSDNILKQKQFFGDGIKDSEKIQAKYEPLNNALKEQGLDKDSIRGYSSAGAKRDCPSMCYGIKTPLGNTFVMDDGYRDDDNKTVWKWSTNGYDNLGGNGDVRQARKLVGNGGLSPWQRKPGSKEDERKNAGFRLRTRNGTQILIADEGTVYLINKDGSCWVEMTKNGFLEGYSKKGVAISSDGDINLHSSKNIYIECDETLAVKAKKINIETDAGKDSSEDAIGGDINIAKTAHINTNAVISANEVYARKGKIDTFESMGVKVIGELAGTFLGYAEADASFFQGKELKKPDILSVEDEKKKLLIKPKEEEKVDVDGQGTSEENNQKIEQTINTKITTHEPYFGHCKWTPKKSDKENEEQENEDNQNENNEDKENSQDSQNENNNTKALQEKNAQTNYAQINNNCSGCNTSSGCSGNNCAPTTSCTGCGGVTNQVNKGFLNEIPASNKQFEDKKLSKYFNLSDLISSYEAKVNNISNVPTSSIVEDNLKALSMDILDNLKQKFPKLQINSGYRSSELNNIVEGSNGSQHLLGQAVDIKVPGMSPYDLAVYIKEHFDYDQLILENPDKNDPNVGWVHLSYNTSNNRHQILTTKNKITKNGLVI